jgi:hypothetical protein
MINFGLIDLLLFNHKQGSKEAERMECTLHQAHKTNG